MNAENTSTDKHTPGPWVASNASNGRNFNHWSVCDRRMCRIAKTDQMPGGNSEEEYANARLIAAAPDLLAAVKWAGQCLEAYLCADSQEGRDYCRKDLESAHQMACAAIAKAEGGAE